MRQRTHSCRVLTRRRTSPRNLVRDFPFRPFPLRRVHHRPHYVWGSCRGWARSARMGLTRPRRDLTHNPIPPPVGHEPTVLLCCSWCPSRLLRQFQIVARVISKNSRQWRPIRRRVLASKRSGRPRSSASGSRVRSDRLLCVTASTASRASSNRGARSCVSSSTHSSRSSAAATTTRRRPARRLAPAAALAALAALAAATLAVAATATG